MIEYLNELIKTFTVAQELAAFSKKSEDIERVKKLLAEINAIRISLAVTAEQQEIFYSQINVAAATSANAVVNNWYSKNDIRYLIKRGVAALLIGTQISLENQGQKNKVITRNNVNWQQLFASVQSVALGQQILFDLPETLRFGENQSLNIGIKGQTSTGYIFLHGATLKESITEKYIAELRAEFVEADGTTKYLPETQIVPLSFVFPSATINTFATDSNGEQDIFTDKNERSVLLTHVGTTATNCRIDKLTDASKNQTICERIEMAGVAANYQNPYQVFYELPTPHLLRRGSRLKANIQNGSPLAADATQSANVLNHLVFKGITL